MSKKKRNFEVERTPKKVKFEESSLKAKKRRLENEENINTKRIKCNPRKKIKYDSCKSFFY